MPSILQRLIEKGRVLSKTNETKIRTAMTTLGEVLAAVAGGMPMNEAQRAQFTDATTVLLEAELSYDQQRQTVNTALRKVLGDVGYCYVQEMYADWLVYEQYDRLSDGETLYKVSYSIDDAGAVTFGTPQAVIGRMVYEPVITGMMESAGPVPVVRLVETAVVPLMEQAVKADGTVAIKVISPGWGSSGFYGADVLERDGPSTFPAGTHLYANHPSLSESIERPERDIRDLAATLTTGASWDANGVDGPGLYATAEIQDAYAGMINDLAEHIGVSINTSGRVREGEAEGKRGPVIEALMSDPLTSIDFVTRAGAGGKVLQLFEAARGHTPIQEAPMALTPEEEKALREQLASMQTDNARLRETALLSTARDAVTRHLAGKADLLEATKARIAAQLATQVGSLPLKDGALDTTAYATRIDEAVAAEQTYLASVTGAGEIRGMGGSSASTGMVDTAALEEAFVALGLPSSAAKIAAVGR